MISLGGQADRNLKLEENRRNRYLADLFLYAKGFARESNLSFVKAGELLAEFRGMTESELNDQFEDYRRERERQSR